MGGGFPAIKIYLHTYTGAIVHAQYNTCTETEFYLGVQHNDRKRVL